MISSILYSLFPGIPLFFQLLFTATVLVIVFVLFWSVLLFIKSILFERNLPSPGGEEEIVVTCFALLFSLLCFDDLLNYLNKHVKISLWQRLAMLAVSIVIAFLVLLVFSIITTSFLDFIAYSVIGCVLTGTFGAILLLVAEGSPNWLYVPFVLLFLFFMTFIGFGIVQNKNVLISTTTKEQMVRIVYAQEQYKADNNGKYSDDIEELSSYDAELASVPEGFFRINLSKTNPEYYTVVSQWGLQNNSSKRNSSKGFALQGNSFGIYGTCKAPIGCSEEGTWQIDESIPDGLPAVFPMPPNGSAAVGKELERNPSAEVCEKPILNPYTGENPYAHENRCFMNQNRTNNQAVTSE